MNPLYLSQKKIIRIITFSHYVSHTQPLFQDLSILPLENLDLYRIVIIMYKMSNGLIPKTMSGLYITNTFFLLPFDSISNPFKYMLLMSFFLLSYSLNRSYNIK